MINLLLCGNEKVFDGALTELISITNRTHESIKCYIFTAELTRIKPEYTGRIFRQSSQTKKLKK